MSLRLTSLTQPLPQGTNEQGHTGLFPFSYATKNQELAENAKALALSAGEAPQPNANSAPGQSQPGVMNSTMADVDQALTELRADDSTTRRRSFQSERTADLSGDDDLTEEGENEYQSRANARAALAANAKADAALQQQKEKEDAERRRIHAKKVFEEEEARHRELLLKKEEERKEAAAKGQLPLNSDKPKVAPIEGVDMSDESDSEGSANGLDTYSSQKSQSQNAPTQVDRLALQDSQREHARDPDVKDELDDAPSAPQQADQNGFNAAQQPGSEQNPALQSSSESSSAKPVALAAGGALAATGAVVAGAHAASADSQQRGPSMDSVQQRSQSTDQQSLTGSAKASHQDTASQSGTGTHTAATSIADMQTPKSASAPLATANASPITSASLANRPPAPEGDPHDWTVDQVVEWARSRGWDENAIVSKFQEHEISGDVLLEMDINILKEIDIIAFGKRFQVANAIKELKGQGGLSPALGVPGSSSSGRMASTGAQSYTSGDSQPAAAASSAAAAAAGASTYSGVGLGIPSSQAPDVDTAAANRALSYDTGTVIQHDSPIASASRDRDFTGNSMPPLGSANGTGSMSLSAMADAALLNRQGNNFTPPPQLGALGASGDTPSPRKRASKVPGSGERASFFAGLNPRQRKPPASTPGGTIDEEGKSGRGALSRFGLNRLGRNGQGSGDFKNQISLPTSTPTYDSEGDTARRNRASANGNNEAGRALGGYEAAVGGGHGRQTSVGSAEQQRSEGFNVADSQNGDGPVISRIRPVDVEGWMRKKGERYNVWKPRYLALKGSDLVILRDPQAPKIKGYVSMKGYKVIADENTNPGKYGFKILHETEKPHYFSSDDPVLVREWMKGLMKATIGRDPSFPVISSYNNATISLKEAQSMYPPPRPPSPASRLRTQRAKARENPGELTAKDAAVLMGISQPQKGQTGM